MLTYQQTLARLVGVARQRPVMRALCCPTCGGDITLAGGLLWCSTTERHECRTLAELAVRGA
jgi:hypothetical protein